MVEKEVIQDGDYIDTQIVRKIWQNAAKTGTWKERCSMPTSQSEAHQCFIYIYMPGTKICKGCVGLIK